MRIVRSTVDFPSFWGQDARAARSGLRRLLERAFDPVQTIRLACLLTLGLVLCTSPVRGEAMPLAGVLNRHCVECHGDFVSEADLRLDKLLADADFDRDFLKWEHLLGRLVDRTMPPPDHGSAPTDAEYDQMIDWLRVKLSAIELRRAETAPRWMRRLNRAEYDNTIRDLFGVTGLSPSGAFPEDDALHGFDNVAEGLTLSPLHVEAYLDAADAILSEALIVGPQPETRTLRHTFNYYEKKDGDAQLRVRDGNSILGKQGETRRWVGGPFHGRFDVQHSGLYRITVRGRPHQFDGAVAGFVTTMNQSHRQAHDVRPEGEGLIEIVGREIRLTAGGSQVFEIDWTENQHRLGQRRAGISESASPFRQLSAVQKMFPNERDRWFNELGWPYFTDLEVEIVGPIYESWPPPATERLLSPAGGQERFEPILKAFLPRAFRRPVKDDEVAVFVAIAEAEQAAGEPFLEALRQAIAAALVSPDFLFLIETPPPESQRGGYVLNDYELASRLSYFLWSTMPDDRLFELAAAGRLSQPDVLRAEVDRMLADPRDSAMTDGFAAQWLGTRRIPALMPEPALFRDVFDDAVHDAIAREPLEFFETIRRENRPITDFLASDFAVVNGPLARFYGIEGVEGQTFRKVPIADPNRGSLVTQAGFLTLTSEATRTSPIKRGAWILERLFHRPPPPPPPNVGTLITEDDPTLRPIHEHLNKHREIAACATCHRRIDPYGLALERFDAVGSYREKEKVLPPEQVYLPAYKQKPVFFEFPKETVFEDGTAVGSVPEFKEYLLGRKNDFARGLTEQLMIYCLGRRLLVRDQDDIDQIVDQLADADYRFGELVRQVVLSEAFRTR